MGPLGSMITLNVFYYYEITCSFAGRTPLLNFISSFLRMPVLQLSQGLLFFLVIPQASPHWLILHTYPEGDVTP